MFFLTIKRFVKSPVFLTGTIIYFILLYFLLPTHVANVLEGISNSTLTTVAFSFIFFAFSSYEFFYRIKIYKLEELVKVSPLGELREKIYGFSFFALLDFVVYVLFVSISMWGAVEVLGYFNQEWFLMIIKSFFVHHFLVYLFAVLLGMIVALINDRILAVGTLTIVFAFFSRILLPIIMFSAANSEERTKILDIFGIMNRNYFVLTDLYYNYSYEKVEFQRIFFWIFLSVAILFFFVLRKRKIECSLGFLLCAIVCFCLFVQPSGERYVGGDWGAYMEDSQYYSVHWYTVGSSKDYKKIGRKYREAGFKVLKYSGRISAKRQLETQLDVEVDEPNLEEYCFTLYHGYQVEKVLDPEGVQLPFEQDIDHILVRNPQNKNLSVMRFIYSGHSRKYVATSQAVFLTGNFPYIPYPGFRQYKKEVEDGIYCDNDYDLSGLAYQVEYDIEFDTKNKVYSNLDSKDQIHFSGRTKGASFFASPFLKTAEIDGATVYYSEIGGEFMPANLDQSLKKCENAIKGRGGIGLKKNLKIFCPGAMGDNETSWYMNEDSIVATPYGIEDLVDFYSKNKYVPNLTEQYDMEEQETW